MICISRQLPDSLPTRLPTAGTSSKRSNSELSEGEKFTFSIFNAWGVFDAILLGSKSRRTWAQIMKRSQICTKKVNIWLLMIRFFSWKNWRITSVPYLDIIHLIFSWQTSVARSAGAITKRGRNANIYHVCTSFTPLVSVRGSRTRLVVVFWISVWTLFYCKNGQNFVIFEHA